MKDTGMMVGALFLGAIIGAAAGLLLAPGKGSETREKLGKGTKDLAGRLYKIKNQQLNDFEDEYETILGL